MKSNFWRSMWKPWNRTCKAQKTSSNWKMTTYKSWKSSKLASKRTILHRNRADKKSRDSLRNRRAKTRLSKTELTFLRKKLKVLRKRWRKGINSLKMSRKRRTNTSRYLRKSMSILSSLRKDWRSKQMKQMFWRKIKKTWSNSGTNTRKMKKSWEKRSRNSLKRWIKWKRRWWTSWTRTKLGSVNCKRRKLKPKKEPWSTKRSMKISTKKMSS